MVLQPPSIVATQGGQIVSNSFVVAQWVDGLIFSLNPPLCQVYATVSQSIPDNAATAILYDSEVTDLYGMHSTSSNTSRITPTAPGYYEVSGGAVYGFNANGSRKCQPYVNGAPINYASGQVPPVGASSGLGTAVGCPTVELFFNGTTDYVELFAFQDSGGALSINPNVSNESFLRVKWSHA